MSRLDRALARSKEIPGEVVTITAPITVPKSVERFSEIKVADTITARYYDNIVTRLKPAGEHIAHARLPECGLP